MKDKIRVYVCSFKGISALEYVDKESMGHPCVTSRHGENIFSEFKHLPKGTLDGHLTDEQKGLLHVVSEFCKENGLEYEVVDVRDLSFMSKLKLLFRGIRAPTISFKGKRIEGFSTKENLKALVGT